MLPWVAELAESRVGQSAEATLRAQCLHGLADLDKVYGSPRGPRFLTAEQEKAAAGHCMLALDALARLVQLRPEGPWKFVPKGRALLHIALDSAMGNPGLSTATRTRTLWGGSSGSTRLATGGRLR